MTTASAQKAWETRRKNQGLVKTATKAVTKSESKETELELLTMGEMAEKLGISYPTLHAHLGESSFPRLVKIGKRFFFRSTDFNMLQIFFGSRVDSPANKAWETRRKNGGVAAEKQPRNEVVDAYIASIQPGASKTVKAKATRLINDLCTKRAADGKNPNMVLAGIKAHASRRLNAS